MMNPGGGTRLCALLGSPVLHSLSPVIHNAALGRDARDAVYLAFDVSAENLPDAVTGLRALGAVGANVTIPHKESVLTIADSASATAVRVGATNTLCFRNGKVFADNTDVEAVTAAVAALGLEPHGLAWLVLGAGGSGRAVAWSAMAAEARTVVITNRSPERAGRLAEDLRAVGCEARTVPWPARGDAVEGADVIVNATSLGLDGETSPLGPPELERAALSGCRGVLDLVYGPGETQLVHDARAVGLLASDGLEMLVAQAAASYRLWWDAEPPVEVMRAAALEAVGRSPAPRAADRRPLA